MAWLRDPAWRQGVAILFVVGGASLIYLGAADREPGGMARVGVALFLIGMALPLVSQALRPSRETTGRNEDV